MKALILAAGKGTRLRPITDFIPKPMVPIHGKPLLEWVILHLMSYGIQEYVVAVSYFAEQIENYFGDGTRWGIRIEYSHGLSPAGKAGEIWRCRELLTNEHHFLVVPGDTICHLNYHAFMDFHERQGGIASVALSTKYRLEVGLAEVASDSRITAFLEKTNLDRPVSTGSYLLESSIFPYIERFNPSKNEVDLPGDIFPVLLLEGQQINGFVSEYEWWDIGKINDYDTFAHMPVQQAKSILCSYKNVY
ncbi:nucleotidyltransferase family protein [Pelosinus propionicus]|uniref:Nucleotidyl transferase n=1 Tax=Pelosinus propionicus DSM 13327 TaxID=1123291 RepID=A0A1I4K806_9FIRM|nr:nucleotidyltransferase family protein [Pelosinus propionicus]SFL74749.1 Nucleotidyl transferase [Pelosinus propionicus DSM 13327]